MKKAIIHIGAHKTGSTVIQGALHKNSRVLESIGIQYPLSLTDARSWMLGQHVLAYALRGKDQLNAFYEGTNSLSTNGVDPLNHISNIDRSKDLILSSENFLLLSSAQIGELKRLLDGFSVEVLLYVRRQDESAQSLYQTDILSQGVAYGFQAYFLARADLFDYYAIARRWAEVFGKESIHVKRYDRTALLNSDALADFVHFAEDVLGKDLGAQSWLPSDAGSDNRGLPENVVCLARYYNSRPGSQQIVERLRRLGSLVYKSAKGRYELIPPSERRKLLEHFRASNQALVEEFISDGRGNLWAKEEGSAADDAAWRQKYGFEGAHLSSLLDDTATFIRSLEKKVGEPREPALRQAVTSGDSRQYSSLHALAARMSEEEWANLVADSVEGPISIANMDMPSAPHPDTQKIFSGDSGRSAILKTALPIYSYAMRHCRQQGVDVKRILDFGCGWGRITRLFLREVDEGGLYGVDPWPEAIQMARVHMPYGSFLRSDYEPPLLFHDGYFDLVFANSVFSHLSESSAGAWVKEIQRVLKPGGIFVGTTMPSYFIDMLGDLKSGRMACTTAWHDKLIGVDADPGDLKSAHQNGEFIFLDTHKGGKLSGVYGEAFAPKAYVEKEWGQDMRLVDYTDDRKQFQQANFVLKKV